MKRAKPVQPTSETDDETMAMVYVGDVYSLVAQEAVDHTNKDEIKAQTQKDDQDDDAVLPFIR